MDGFMCMFFTNYNVLHKCKNIVVFVLLVFMLWKLKAN